MRLRPGVPCLLPLAAAIAPAILATEKQAALQERLNRIYPLLIQLADFLQKASTGVLDIQTKSTERDLVTFADKESEQRLVDFIRREFPEDSILAEEGSDYTGQSDFQWVIDPLDGTINFAHGLPLYNISVGLALSGKPVAGSVIMPALGEHYQAVQGLGASCNGKPVRVSACGRPGNALAVTGFPYDREKHMATLIRGVERVLSHCRGLRRTGSAALDLCWLATGRFDIFYEHFLNPWDICAGAIILEEAGGRITALDGSEFRLEMPAILASNGILHEQALAIFSDLAAWRS